MDNSLARSSAVQYAMKVQAYQRTKTVDTFNESVVHRAVMDGDLALTESLVQAGANLRVTDMKDQTPLHKAVLSRHEHIVRYLVGKLKEVKQHHSAINDADSLGYTPLHWAAVKGLVDIANLLIEYGAGLNLRSKEMDFTPIELAVVHGNVAIVESLYFLYEVNRFYTPLRELILLACQYGHVNCLKMLLGKGESITRMTKEGISCLELAIIKGRRNVVREILEFDNWRELMKHAYYSEEVLVTPLRLLIQEMPDMAEKVFGKCTKSDDERFNEYDYGLIEDQWVICSWMDNKDEMTDRQARAYTRNKQLVSRNHPLNIMIKSERDELLGHPLVTSIIEAKWNKSGRYVYYANLFLHIVFLIFITAFALTIPSPFSVVTSNYNTSMMSAARMMASCESQQHWVNRTDQFASVSERALASSSMSICLFLITVKFVVEIILLVKAKRHYFRKGKIAKWGLISTTVMFLLPFPCEYYREPWQWEAGAIAIILTWMHLTLIMRRVLKAGIYVTMFVQTLQTCLKVLFAMMFAFIGFIISFYMLMANQAAFSKLHNSLVKTMILVTGEFEFDSSFNSAPEVEVLYPYVTYLVYLLFIFLMSVVFMNLLVALAIDDIKGMEAKAGLTIKAMQVDLILMVEAVLPTNLTRIDSMGTAICCMEKSNTLVEGYKGYQSSSVTKPDVVDNNQLMEKLERLERVEEQISAMRESSKSLMKRQSKMERRLTTFSETFDFKVTVLLEKLEQFSSKAAEPEMTESRRPVDTETNFNSSHAPNSPKVYSPFHSEPSLLHHTKETHS